MQAVPPAACVYLHSSDALGNFVAANVMNTATVRKKLPLLARKLLLLLIVVLYPVWTPRTGGTLSTSADAAPSAPK